jgi:hypothetical protein
MQNATVKDNAGKTEWASKFKARTTELEPLNQWLSNCDPEGTHTP